MKNKNTFKSRTKNFILFLACFTFVNQVSSQNKTTLEPIEVTKVLGTVFKQSGKSLHPWKLKKALISNSNAYSLMKKANRNYNTNLVLGIAGGLLIGTPIAQWIEGDNNPNWALAGIGGGFVAVSIPFSMKYMKHAKQAVNIYNDDLTKTGYKTELNFKLNINANQFGLALVF